MNEIQKIYNLIYSPIITPFNLLENSKLDNYSYVKYYKGENGLISEMKCIEKDGLSRIFYYHFDKEDNLIQIFMEQDSKQQLVFDRNNELKKEIDNYTLKTEIISLNKIA